MPKVFNFIGHLILALNYAVLSLTITPQEISALGKGKELVLLFLLWKQLRNGRIIWHRN